MTEEIKKKRVNSKGKGSGFENKVAKILGIALAPMKFIRTQGSGARVGGKNFSTTGQLFSQESLGLFVGDVVPVNVSECQFTFRFIVECKAYKDPDKLEALFGASNIYKWVNEVLDDCQKVNKEGIVIFKWNNTPIYAAVSHHIELPIGINFITLTNGIKVCHLDKLLEHQGFWLEAKF